MRRETQIRVPPAGHGTRLVDFLAARFTYHSLAAWRDRIVTGRITLNGAPGSPDALLKSGDQVAYDTSDLPEPPVDPSFRVLFADDALMVIDKSGNLPCHPSGRYFNHTLWALLKAQYDLTAPCFVNRLDRETSGLVVVACTAAAARACRAQWVSRTVEKRYLALVEGAFPTEITARGWMIADRAGEVRKRRRFVWEADADADARQEGEAAETVFRLVARHGALSEIEARPMTGRLHQIRATLVALGYPLVGDKLYGADPAWFVKFCQGRLDDADHARLRLPRQALHAAGLRFRHPLSGTLLSFDLPLPVDLRRVGELAARTAEHPDERHHDRADGIGQSVP